MVISRKMAEGIFGGHQPRDIAAAVALGILAGALAGGNLSFVPVLLAAILFNVHTRLFLAAWLASLLLAWLSRGSLETLGQFLLDGTPLGRVIGFLGDGPLVALLGWDEYALIGSLAAGATAAVAGAAGAYWLTCRRQQTCRPNAANLPGGELRPDDGPGGKDRPLQLRYMPVFYGPSSRERAIRQTMAPHRLRPCGIPAALAAAVTAAVATWSLARLSMEHELWRQLSLYNGAEVSGVRTQLSLPSGDFVVHDLAIADPAHPDRDRFRIGVAKGRLSPGLLLRGRLNIESLVLARVRADAARPQPARLYDACDTDQNTDIDRNLLPYSPSTGDLEVSRYVRPWDSICRRLGDLQRLVAAVERLPSAEAIGESSRHCRRSDLGRPQPRVAVRELRVDGLPSAWNLGRKVLLEMANLSSSPSLADKPAQVRILLPKFGAEVQLDFASNGSRTHAIRCWACNVDVDQCIDAPLAVSGRARLAGQGSFDGQQLEMRVVAEIESLTAEVTNHEPLMGVEPRIWNRGCSQLEACNAQIVCFGRWTSPGVVIDRERLVEQITGRLRTLGEEGLVATIEQQTARYLEREASLLEETLAVPTVVQATAIEMQAADIDTPPNVLEARTSPAEPSQPGICYLPTGDESQPTGRAETPPPHAPDASSDSDLTYPTTSVPYDDTEYVSPPASIPYDDAERVSQPSPSTIWPAERSPARQRPLPGPVQMMVGRDRYTGPRTPLAAFGVEPAPRDNLWSRWTQGLRQKFDRAFAKPESVTTEPLESADTVPAEQDRPASAASSEAPITAGEAWYNRKWR